MNLADIKLVYFLGIGGIGMSAIARYFKSMGLEVAGYDRIESELTRQLSAEGIGVHYDDLGPGVESILTRSGGHKKAILVVLTPAIPKDHAEWNWLRDQGYTIMKRSQVLGVITNAYHTIAVAGTHGKTTTSTLIAHIMKSAPQDCGAFLGGISTNYQSNLLLHRKAGVSKGQFMVVEADEFDRSFLTLFPSIAVITSTDADHLDIYGEHDELRKSFIDFACQTQEILVLKKELDIFENQEWRTANRMKAKVRSYSIKQVADYYATAIRIEGDQYVFNLHGPGVELRDVTSGIPGLHNVENAVAAAGAALEAGVDPELVRAGITSYKGVKRRFEYIIKSKDMVYIDDYAHHPEELKAIISSVQQMYPDKKITVIFQPHLFSRTRDFAEGFAASLSLAKDVILLDIYPARELPIPGVTSEMIFNKMTSDQKMLCSKTDAVEMIRKKKPDVLLTLGAGDIDRLVEPIRKLLTEIKRVA